MKVLKYKDLFTKEFLETEHITKNKNINVIATENKVGYSLIKRYMKYHGISITPAEYKNRKAAMNANWSGYEEIPLTYWNSVLKNKDSSAKKMKDFDLTIEYIWDLFLKQNRKCAFSGVLLEFTASKNITASLDRIDSSKGYTKNNVQWVHKDINKMKSNYSSQYFIEQCKLVASYCK